MQNQDLHDALAASRPGALGFNLEKNVDSWNFQESYLDAHLTPLWKVPKNPSEGNFLFKMAAIATDWLFL